MIIHGRVEQEGPVWYVTAVEMDYLAEGSTEAKARQHFEDGLRATLRLRGEPDPEIIFLEAD